jgi:hypothetical protein
MISICSMNNEKFNCSGKIKKRYNKEICLKHYLFSKYGQCTGEHFNFTVANGKDSYCGWCRSKIKNGKLPKFDDKRILNLLGRVNKNNILVVDGPIRSYGKYKNAVGWAMLCPFCNQTFISTSNRFKNISSCYSCRGETKKVSSEESTLKHLYSGVKGRKKSKERGFNITFDQFKKLVKSPCHYCGSKGYVSKGHRDWSADVLVNGLDRLDSSIGYLYDNVVPCCRVCNSAKSDMKYSEFMDWIDMLIKYRSV